MHRLKGLKLVEGLQRLCEEVLCGQAQRIDGAKDFMLIKGTLAYSQLSLQLCYWWTNWIQLCQPASLQLAVELKQGNDCEEFLDHVSAQVCD